MFGLLPYEVEVLQIVLQMRLLRLCPELAAKNQEEWIYKLMLYAGLGLSYA